MIHSWKANNLDCQLCSMIYTCRCFIPAGIIVLRLKWSDGGSFRLIKLIYTIYCYNYCYSYTVLYISRCHTWHGKGPELTENTYRDHV